VTWVSGGLKLHVLDGRRSLAHEMYVKQAMVLSASCDEPMLFWELGSNW
jgi:hypothetical protein